MVYAGIPEVMIANEIVDPVSSLRRAVNLARQARVLMIVDDCENVKTRRWRGTQRGCRLARFD